MGIIAWIVLGLAAGLLANMLIPGKRSQGLIITCLIGIAGALGGGWAATELFHVHTLHGFFNLSTWLTAIVGAAVLLVVYRAVNGRSGHAVGGRGGRRMVRR
ncbi:MAG: GlsB/YeaQ/YmgE family stress response membrane protein [Streptosporangiaceae bacterium]